MKKFLHSHDGASKGAALIIVLAFVVLATVLGLAYLSRTATDRQLAQSSSNDNTADLLARSALDITVSDLKQEIAGNQPVNASNIQPLRYGVPPITDPTPIPNLIRRSFFGDPTGRTSSVNSGTVSANGRFVSLARWNRHYLVPLRSPLDACTPTPTPTPTASPTPAPTTYDSMPVCSFIAPDWVLVTGQGPTLAPSPNAVIGRYAFTVYDEGGLIDMNVGGFPNYAGLSRPVRPARRPAPKFRSEQSEIILTDCQVPGFTPGHINASGSTGVPFTPLTPSTNHNPTTFGPDTLPHGLVVNPNTGTISGTPTSPGTFTVTLSASNACGTGYGTLYLTINGMPSPDSSPWPVNLARKGTVAFADLTTLPSTPTVINPTTPVGSMTGFPSPTPINKFMGWRNYATTQQPSSSSFDIPSFPLASADYYARYFLGASLPFTTDFKTVSTALQNNRTDQGVMTRQELIKLQTTIGNTNNNFIPSLLQYLGTFSREQNQPAPDWPQLSGALAAARWDMNNLALAIPDAWIVYPGHSGIGHAYGLQRHTQFAQLFGLIWVNGTFTPGTRFTDPNYYGHWKYIHQLDPLPANNPDFFQIIDYAMNQAVGVTDPNHVRNTFTVGAALIDQYDTDDLYDPDPNPPNNGSFGNTITIIDTVGNGNFADYVYGIEGMTYDDPNPNSGDPSRPPFAPFFVSPGWSPPANYPPPANYALLNRRFENVGEFGYAYNPVSITASKTLDFASSASHDRALLDFFTYNTAFKRSGIVNLNTRNVGVLASIIRGAWLQDPGAEIPPPDASYLMSPSQALDAGEAIVQETTSGGGPVLSRADVARLAAAATNRLVRDGFWSSPVSDEKKETIARALAEVGQARTWNLLIDVIAQTGQYKPNAPDLAGGNFIVQGEKRYWLHIALARDLNADGTVNVLGSQLEEVTE